MDVKGEEDGRLNYNFQVYLDNWLVNGAFIMMRNIEIGAEFEGENDQFLLVHVHHVYKRKCNNVIYRTLLG